MRNQSWERRIACYGKTCVPKTQAKTENLDIASLEGILEYNNSRIQTADILSILLEIAL